MNAICDHPSIRAISFVGGDRAGKHIFERYVQCRALYDLSSSVAHGCTGVRLMGNAYRYVATGCFGLERMEDIDVTMKANMGAKNHAVIMPDGKTFYQYLCPIVY